MTLLTPVTTLAGTPHQIAVSAPLGAVTLTLPQDIDPDAAPTFTDVTLQGVQGPTALTATLAGSGTAGPFLPDGAQVSYALTGVDAAGRETPQAIAALVNATPARPVMLTWVAGARYGGTRVYRYNQGDGHSYRVATLPPDALTWTDDGAVGWSGPVYDDAAYIPAGTSRVEGPLLLPTRPPVQAGAGNVAVLDVGDGIRDETQPGGIGGPPTLIRVSTQASVGNNAVVVYANGVRVFGVDDYGDLFATTQSIGALSVDLLTDDALFQVAGPHGLKAQFISATQTYYETLGGLWNSALPGWQSLNANVSVFQWVYTYNDPLYRLRAGASDDLNNVTLRDALTVGATGQVNSAAPATDPALLGPAQVTMALDEAANTLIVTAKYSNGTTVKSGSIALS